MKNRIVAWILLCGFVLLFLNLVFFRYQAMLSLMIYMLFVALFFYFKYMNDRKDRNE